MQAVVTRILHVFVDALPHVPEHRRTPILRELLGTLGPAQFLWVLMLLLFKQHATSTAISNTGAEKVSLFNVICKLQLLSYTPYYCYENKRALFFTLV